MRRVRTPYIKIYLTTCSDLVVWLSGCLEEEVRRAVMKNGGQCRDEQQGFIW